MNIEQDHVRSTLISDDESFVSTLEDLPPDIFSFESNHFNPLISTPIGNVHSTLLNDQLHFEHHLANQSSILTEQSFVTTYSNLHTMFSQIQIKLSSVFLYETEYLKQREDDLQINENNLTKCFEQIQQIESQRRQLEIDFSNLQDRLNQAVDYLSQFQTDGERILQNLFCQSHQIDADLSALICECLASLTRCRTMINEKIHDFSLKSNRIQSNVFERQNQIYHVQLSITSLFELIKQLNEQNIEHSNQLTVTSKHVENKSQQYCEQLETTKIYWNIRKQLDEIQILEKQKHQLRKELFEQTMLLENINAIIAKAIIN